MKAVFTNGRRRARLTSSSRPSGPVLNAGRCSPPGASREKSQAGLGRLLAPCRLPDSFPARRALGFQRQCFAALWWQLLPSAVSRELGRTAEPSSSALESETPVRVKPSPLPLPTFGARREPGLAPRTSNPAAPSASPSRGSHCALQVPQAEPGKPNAVAQRLHLVPRAPALSPMRARWRETRGLNPEPSH